MSIHDKWTQTSEGWWIIEPEECEVLFTSTAKNKKVLVHISEVSDSTSIWGEVTESICGQTKLFLVNYIDECPDGYDRYPAFQLLTQGVENVILNLEEDKSINYQY